MLHFNDIVVVSRILGKHRLPKTEFPAYTLQLMMPFEKPGVVSTYAFKAGAPFDTYRALFTANLRQPEVQAEMMYRAQGYFRGIAKAKNNDIYYNHSLVLTSLSALGPVKLSFDPIAQIMAAGSSDRSVENFDSELYVVRDNEGQNE